MGFTNAATAYAALDPSLTTPGRAEAMVFAGVTRRMEAAFADADGSHAAKVAALHDNRRLWQAAAIACASDENALAPALRASLMSLAGFVDRHTSEVMGGSAEPAILVEINRRVAAGLSASGF